MHTKKPSTPELTIEQIGQVTLEHTASADTAPYQDGAEDRLLDIFQAQDSQVQIETLLASPDLDWPMLYHLSPQRQFLFNAIEFEPTATVLEVGAGCGAITGAFIDQVKQVTAVELTTQRARILAQRYHDKTNLRVVAGNIDDLPADEKFDYVTCIGVLEYAGKYIHDKKPAEKLLETLHARLKPGGVLLLAIENAFGLKYWSGAGEDHTGKLFDSIEGYPAHEGIRTFSQQELHQLLKRTGFTHQTWQYPLPDYKMPVEIFSDAYLPTIDHHMRLDVYPAQDHGRNREVLFNERRTWMHIIRAQQFPFFANSFFVVAQTELQ